MSVDVAMITTAPVSVLVTDPEWEADLRAWAATEADLRHSEVRVFRPARADRIPETLRREASPVPGGLIVVGPVSPAFLAELVFGPNGEGGRSAIAVVPPASTPRPHPEAEGRMITVGFHGSPSSQAALRWAMSEARARDAVVRAVLAWSEDRYGTIEGAVRVDPHLHSLPGVAATELAERSVGESGLDGSPVEPVARRGSPVRVLAEEAAGSALLVVGAGRSRVYQRRLCGMTTLGCVAASTVPLIVVPRPLPWDQSP